jgi:hypothetical protein
VAALTEAHPDIAKRKVAVIGAGAAGMTAASGLQRVGVSDVTVFDQAAAPLHPQRASHTRYLHPRLFHWPEAGWQNARAGLPVGSWDADYADVVRESVLSNVGGPPIRFCTSVIDVLDADRPRLRVRRLGEHTVEEDVFDVVMVATGFPCERPAQGALGGSYWHSIEALDLLPPEVRVRVAGDGDSALTEVLMLFIDRFGHRGVEALAEMLPINEALREADFMAHGQPGDNADPPLECRSPSLLKRLEELDARGHGGVRVVIHADHALKGKSFLLNRILVTHLRWTTRAPVDVQPQNLTSGSHPSGDPVIWRVGIGGAVSPRRFEVSRLATARVLEQMSMGDPISAGILAQTIDALRRPMWTTVFEHRLNPGAGWRAEAPTTLSLACGKPTKSARASLPDIARTFLALRNLGVPIRPDAAHRSGSDVWISIETVVRCTSLSHEDCVDATTEASPEIRRDQLGRLWFRPHDTKDGRTTRAGVAALAEPRGALEQWMSAEDVTSRLKDADAAVLSGLADISLAGGRVQAKLADLHTRAGRSEEAISVLLRMARVPDGHDGRARTASRVRGAMLEVASILTSESNDNGYFEPEDAWLILAGAGAQLRTVASDGPLTVTSSFLTRRWAPRVRAVVQRTSPPRWFQPLAAHAFELPSAERGLRDVVVRLTRSELGARDDLQQRPAPLARFGVWLDTADAESIVLP